jgi:hypothetical protein
MMAPLISFSVLMIMALNVLATAATSDLNHVNAETPSIGNLHIIQSTESPSNNAIASTHSPHDFNDLQCPICWDTCNAPCNIDDITEPLQDSTCGHMFCEACIKAWIDAWHDTRGPDHHDQFECPRCFKKKRCALSAEHQQAPNMVRQRRPIPHPHPMQHENELGNRRGVFQNIDHEHVNEDDVAGAFLVSLVLNFLICMVIPGAISMYTKFG